MGRLASGWAVFAADPAVVAQVVQQAEEVGVIHFTGVGFVAVGDAGNLDVADMIEIGRASCRERV